MPEKHLPYRLFDFAASLFAGETTGFSHSDMAAFFCHELNKHSNEIGIPGNINRPEKFKWFLGLFSAGEQRRVLELLCRNRYKHPYSYSWPSQEDRDRLLQMLAGSPIEMPTEAATFDTASIREAWRKSLDRIPGEPDGAITAARTLLESVCKHILDEINVEYSDNADLPKLYGLTSKELNLAPSQHTEEAFRKILGGAHSVVDGLANLRNRLGDAHGHGKRPVKPLPRHAELAVNMAGSIASFLLTTFEAKHSKE
jgi:hypothetical protein